MGAAPHGSRVVSTDGVQAPLPGPGLAIEAATSHVEVLVVDGQGEPLAHLLEEIGHGHTRRLVPLVASVMERAGLAPGALRWVAADLGPGSFTGVRVGLATAHALALASGAQVRGASSLAALALGTRAKSSLMVPLVPAGRRDLYAGFFRADSRGVIHLLAAPQVGTPSALLDAVAEARAACGGSAARDPELRFVGPGAARERETLEAAWPGSTSPEWRFEGLSAHDLAVAAARARGPAAGLPRTGSPLRPLYVRSAQAEERVRHAASDPGAITIRAFGAGDVAEVAAIERAVFPDPWPESAFLAELKAAWAWARIAERNGQVAGYLVAMFGEGAGHLGNIAVTREARRRGVARALVEDLLARALALGVTTIGLEVRVSNFEAQALYRALGFRLAGLRHGYYRDTGEDALIMTWQDPARRTAVRGVVAARAPRAGVGPTGTL
jgi:tRNA threonylcarbamoyl adenosine modification protein YeaZ/ribosomal-protein-alanine acetyltransferase